MQQFLDHTDHTDDGEVLVGVVLGSGALILLVVIAFVILASCIAHTHKEEHVPVKISLGGFGRPTGRARIVSRRYGAPPPGFILPEDTCNEDTNFQQLSRYIEEYFNSNDRSVICTSREFARRALAGHFVYWENTMLHVKGERALCEAYLRLRYDLFNRGITRSADEIFDDPSSYVAEKVQEFLSGLVQTQDSVRPSAPPMPRFASEDVGVAAPDFVRLIAKNEVRYEVLRVRKSLMGWMGRDELMGCEAEAALRRGDKQLSNSYVELLGALKAFGYTDMHSLVNVSADNWIAKGAVDFMRKRAGEREPLLESVWKYSYSHETQAVIERNMEVIDHLFGDLAPWWRHKAVETLEGEYNLFEFLHALESNLGATTRQILSESPGSRLNRRLRELLTSMAAMPEVSEVPGTSKRWGWLFG